MEPVTMFVRAAYWRLIRQNPNYRRLWFAQIVSEIGDWFYSIAIYSLLLDLTGRAESVALALVLQVLPQTFTGPVAGVVNDRVSRRRVMIAADLARVAIVLSMLLVSSRSMVWLVYPLLFFETVMAAFFEPARTAVIPNITERDQFTTANTLSAATWSFNLAIGSALGGLVGLLLGRNAVFVLNALSFLVSALLIVRMRFHETHLREAPRLRFRDLLDFSPVVQGMRYIAHDRTRLVATLAKSGTAILGSSWVLFPVKGVPDCFHS
jgi:MFS family permease